jgi:hypothetical protein
MGEDDPAQQEKEVDQYPAASVDPRHRIPRGPRIGGLVAAEVLVMKDDDEQGRDA